MEFFYLIYIIIPLFIILNALEADTKEAVKLRLLYAVPSFAMILFVGSLYFLKYLEIIDFIKMVDYNPKLFLVPIFLTLLPIIFYKVGKKKEKYLYVDMAINEAEIARDRQGYKKNIIDVKIKSDDVDSL